MSEIIIGIMTAFLSGGVIVAIVNHCLASTKEREARKSDFRGFLGRWLGRITRERDVSRAYSEWLEHLWGYYGKT